MKNFIHSKYFYPVVVLILAIIIAYYFWNKKIKDTQFELLMGSISDLKTVGGGYSDLKLSNAFSPTYYVGKTVEPLWDSTANIIKKIYDAKGYVKDDEEGILSLFKKFTSQRQTSYISDKFQKEYDKDLYTYLNSFMSNQVIGQRQLGSTNNMVQLQKIVSGLKP